MTTAIFTHPACLLHEMEPWHVESPARLVAVPVKPDSAKR
jgi:hypothetical protein